MCAHTTENHYCKYKGIVDSKSCLDLLRGRPTNMHRTEKLLTILGATTYVNTQTKCSFHYSHQHSLLVSKLSQAYLILLLSR